MSATVYARVGKEKSPSYVYHFEGCGVLTNSMGYEQVTIHDAETKHNKRMGLCCHRSRSREWCCPNKCAQEDGTPIVMEPVGEPGRPKFFLRCPYCVAEMHQLPENYIINASGQVEAKE